MPMTQQSFSSNDLDELHSVVNAEMSSVEKWLEGNKLSLNIVKP